jgi:hypothetical protein
MGVLPESGVPPASTWGLPSPPLLASSAPPDPPLDLDADDDEPPLEPASTPEAASPSAPPFDELDPPPDASELDCEPSILTAPASLDTSADSAPHAATSQIA